MDLLLQIGFATLIGPSRFIESVSAPPASQTAKAALSRRLLAFHRTVRAWAPRATTAAPHPRRSGRHPSRCRPAPGRCHRRPPQFRARLPSAAVCCEVQAETPEAPDNADI